ncbi:MAG: V-type ATPase subunit [Candidatus Nanosalina sp.]
MNARVSAKGAKLLERQDYEQLIKMESNEIARRLEEGSYSDEIDALGSQLEGVQLVEAALRNNLYRELSQLIEISPNGLKEVIETYIRRIDVTSYKRLIRWKKSSGEEDLWAVVAPGYRLSMERIEELSEKELEEIIDEINLDTEKDYTSEMNASDSLEELENALDTAYFSELLAKAEKTGNQQFIKFVESEIEYENVRTILRLKKHDVSEEDIRERLIDVGDNKLTEKCIEADGFKRTVEILEESDWEVEEGSLENIEHQLKIARRRKARTAMKTESMGLTSVLAYILAKIVEVNNLRMIVQAKATGLQTQEEIKENLVIDE